MKYLICADLHGSAYYANKLIEVFNNEKVDLLILLGDVYNHGPRNPLPKDYAPMTVADILNGIKDKLLVIKGNCDSEVDTMISKFDFLSSSVIIDNGKKVFLTHGHIYNKDEKPKTNFDAVIYGHFHTGFVEKIDSTVYANCGSLSLPKGGTPNSYITLENGVLELKNINGEIIETIKL
ncbi:MAG: phosphodiesterase [Clostridia bacterium]|nr:phosphodiesterase [Clostridia bacterium]